MAVVIAVVVVVVFAAVSLVVVKVNFEAVQTEFYPSSQQQQQGDAAHQKSFMNKLKVCKSQPTLSPPRFLFISFLAPNG